MDKERGPSLALGLLLILAGLWFLAGQFVPGLERWAEFSWPLIVVGVGVFLLLLGLATGVPGLAVPASIVGGIGGILFYQNAAGDWESWAYIWTLIPGFVGVGLLLMTLLGEESPGARRGALWLVGISLALFLVFGSFLGGLSLLGPYWPVLLIALGVLLLLRPVLGRRPQPPWT